LAAGPFTSRCPEIPEIDGDFDMPKSLIEETNDQTQPESVVFLRRIAAAKYIQDRYGLRCSKQTLAKLATLGGGPIFRSAGRTPLYAPADLDEWALSRIGKPRTSTSVFSVHS
jgi:hypothetical protein